jgi:radical SAM protein with 4Fe4S-binding SPASM domain
MNLPKITSAMLVLTHKCNLRCRYCFVEKKPEIMSYQVALDAVKFLIANAEEDGSTPSINFFGGEPMLEWDNIIVPLTNYIRQEYGKPFSIGITSNGTLLTQERLDFMKKNNFGFLLSCDGGKETQDYNRPYASGKGSFEEVSKWFRSLLDWIPGMTFRMTSIPATCNNLMNNILFASETGFINCFTIPNIFEKWDTDAREQMKKQLELYSDYYIDCYRRFTRPIVLNPLEECFGEIIRINRATAKRNYRTDSKCSAMGKCGLGANRYGAIHPNGDIYGCQEMTSNDESSQIFKIGNIYSGVDDSKRFALINLFDSKSIHMKECSDCLYNNICDGDCVANNYLLNGDVNKVSEIMCWWKRLLLENAIKIMTVLGDENNEMFAKTWKKVI